MPHELRDVLVVLPGIMGSVLVDAAGKEVWSTSWGALAGGLLSRGRDVQALRLPPGIGDERPDDGVVATALMPDLHVLPGIWSAAVGYDRLRRHLARTFDLVPPQRASEQRPANYLEFPYDWRASNRCSARLLARAVEPLLERYRAVPGHEEARLVFLAHSMGGLVAHHYVDVLGGHAITRKVITLGTPHRGALKALEQLVNGARKGFGPLGVDLTAFARSLPSLHQLLPEYACIESPRGLLKTTEAGVPELDTAMVADAMRFHAELERAAPGAGGYDAHPVLARTQPTATTARLVGGRVDPLPTYQGRDHGGDGTVPRLSAAPYGVPGTSPSLRFVMEQHGSLSANAAVHVELDGILTAADLRPRPAVVPVGVSAPDALLAGEELEVGATSAPDLLLEVVVTSAGGAAQRRHMVEQDGGCYRATFPALPPGGHEVSVRPVGSGAEDTVTAPVVVFAPAR